MLYMIISALGLTTDHVLSGCGSLTKESITAQLVEMKYLDKMKQ